MKKYTPHFILVAFLLLTSITLFTGNAASDTPDYRTRTIYFIVTDRFHAHEPYNPYVDPKNPLATNDINCFENPCPLNAQWRRYWGGDIQGVIQKLDYLQELGISSVWLTPMVQNVPQYETAGWGTGYHGYWANNYYQVNPHFGQWADVSMLSQTLHAREMRYMQDFVLNHSNPNDDHDFGHLYQGINNETFIENYDQDAADNSDPANQFYKHYQDDSRCKDSMTKSDTEWTYWQLHHCLLFDLSGYNQRNPNMARYLIEAGILWADAGVDDFRLDAIKFVFLDFVSLFNHSIIAHAKTQGKEPYIVAEWSNGGVGDDKSLRFANNYKLYATNILDFQLSFALNRFIGGDHEAVSQRMTAINLNDFLVARIAAFQGRDDWQGTFIDNHDQIRTLVRLQKLGVSDSEERERRMDLATVLLMTVRGIPIIFYGDEQYLAHYEDGQDIPAEEINSGNDDPYNRAGMQQWRTDTPAFKIIKTLADLRKSSPAIWQGEYKPVFADIDVLVYERRYNNQVVLVAVNRGNVARNVTITTPIDLPPGEYKNLLEKTSDVNKLNTLSVSPGSAVLHLQGISAFVVRYPDR